MYLAYFYFLMLIYYYVNIFLYIDDNKAVKENKQTIIMTDYTNLAIYLLITLILSLISFLLYFYTRSYSDSSSYICNSTTLTYANLTYISGVTFLWYSVSISLTIYNKWLLNELYGGFKYPLLTTTMHMFIKYLLSRIWYICFYRRIQLNNSGTSTTTSINTINSNNNITLRIIAICIGISTAADVAFSNESIIYLSITMFTTLKSIVLIFTFIWSIILQVEEFNWKILGAVICIVLGVGIAVFSATDFTVSICYI